MRDCTPSWLRTGSALLPCPNPTKLFSICLPPVGKIAVMPGPACAYTVAGAGRAFCRRKQERPKQAKEEQKTPARPFFGRTGVLFWYFGRVMPLFLHRGAQPVDGGVQPFDGLVPAHHAGKVHAAAGGALLARQGDAQRVEQPAVLVLHPLGQGLAGVEQAVPVA